MYTEDVAADDVSLPQNFLVLECYYKHGEYEFATFRSEKSVRSYLEDKISEYSSTLGFYNAENEEELDFTALAREVVRLGQMMIEQQRGWGVVSVVRGKEV